MLLILRRIIEGINKIVERGIMFIASAGNDGPALNTTGSPGSTTTTSIGVGAYLAPEMCEIMYHVLEEVPGMM